MPRSNDSNNFSRLSDKNLALKNVFPSLIHRSCIAALLRDGFRNWADFNLRLLKFYRAQYVTCVVTISKKKENLLCTGGSQFLLGILSLCVFSAIPLEILRQKLKTEFLCCNKNCPKGHALGENVREI
jgi:hypothetical protein